jgi:hypothetical protein
MDAAPGNICSLNLGVDEMGVAQMDVTEIGVVDQDVLEMKRGRNGMEAACVRGGGQETRGPNAHHKDDNGFQ